MSKREQILAATRELLWERGYESTSPAMVMRRSGAGQGSLYHHFGGKKELALTALEGVERELNEKLLATLGDRRLPPLDRIRAWLSVPRDGRRGCRLGRFANEHTLVEDPDLLQPASRYFQRLHQLLLGTLEEAVDEGALPDSIDVPEIATHLVASIQGGYVLSRILQDDDAMAQATAGAITLLDRLAADRSPR